MATPTYRIAGGASTGMNAINIELWGFRQCPHAMPETIAAALACLPPHQLEGLKSVRYERAALVPGFSRWLRLPGMSRLKGSYQRESSTILLHACASREELFYTLFHEAGHFVYYRVLSSFEKKQWVTSVFRSEPPVSRYGSRNASEDFAEAFATSVLYPGSLSGLPGKERFMASVVFRGSAADHAGLRNVMLGLAASGQPQQRLDHYV